MYNSPHTEAFESIVAAKDTAWRASLLIDFAKRFDLTSPEMHSIAEAISQWVYSPDAALRCAAVFSLCYFRPVGGFEWVILAAWPVAPSLDLHWYAGAIENTYQSGHSVDPKLVLTIVGRLLELSPDRSGMGSALGREEERAARTMLEEGSMRALLHLARIMDSEGLLSDTVDPLPKGVDWWQISIALYLCLAKACAV